LWAEGEAVDAVAAPHVDRGAPAPGGGWQRGEGVGRCLWWGGRVGETSGETDTTAPDTTTKECHEIGLNL